MRVHKPKRRQRRSDRRFRLGPWCNGRVLEPGLEFEARVLPSARAAAMTNARHAGDPVRRFTLYVEINYQYNLFQADFMTYVQDQVTAISDAAISSFIVNRTNLMAIDLVQYFNSSSLKLPFFNTPPHTPNNRGAIQNYVYGAVAGGGTTSLLQSLLAIPLPTANGSDLNIYDATVASAIMQSQTQTLNGVSEIYAGQLRVAITSPNNRFG